MDVRGLGTRSLGQLPAAVQAHSLMASDPSHVCIAFGGGSVPDACRVARCAFDEPWVLDPVVWCQPIGRMPSVRDCAGAGAPELIAVATLPGSAAQASQVAAIAPYDGWSRRLIEGQALLPDAFAVYDECWSTMPPGMIADVFDEVIFRLIGPWIMGSGASRSHYISSLLEQLLAGRLSYSTQRSMDAERSRRLIALSEHATRVWRSLEEAPRIHPWWCIQNSLVTVSGATKGTLSAQALPMIVRAALDGLPGWVGDGAPGAREAVEKAWPRVCWLYVMASRCLPIVRGMR